MKRLDLPLAPFAIHDRALKLFGQLQYLFANS